MTKHKHIFRISFEHLFITPELQHAHYQILNQKISIIALNIEFTIKLKEKQFKIPYFKGYSRFIHSLLGGRVKRNRVQKNGA